MHFEELVNLRSGFLLDAQYTWDNLEKAGKFAYCVAGYGRQRNASTIIMWQAGGEIKLFIVVAVGYCSKWVTAALDQGFANSGSPVSQTLVKCIKFYRISL